MATDPSLLIERNASVATLTLNRPDALNTLDNDLMAALVEAAADVAADDSLRVVVLRGAGKHFMAGGDLKTFAAELSRSPAERTAHFRFAIGRLHAAIEQFHRMPHPLVGQVHGAVAGFGLSLMNACDLVVASEDAYFAAAYRNIALSPDGGGSWSLPRIVGPRRAMEILLLAERFDARRALELGLVNRVVPQSQLDATVTELVAVLAAGPLQAMRNTRRLVRESLGRSLSGQLDAEAESFAACAGSDDFVEGISAFLEKRPARFR
jgi:2-(1,2-epoxy-1,2-dihydrophenyl)acetyl-CoA isomerase